MWRLIGIPDCFFLPVVTVTHILRHPSCKGLFEPCTLGLIRDSYQAWDALMCFLWWTSLKPEADFYESEEYLNISVLRWWHVMLVDCTWSEIHSSTMQIQMTPGWMFLLEEAPSMLIFFTTSGFVSCVSPGKNARKHVSTWVGDDDTLHDTSPKASTHGQKTKVLVKQDFLGVNVCKL